jgi:hypothetical protein
MVDSSTVDRGFEPRSCETKDYNVGVCCELLEGQRQTSQSYCRTIALPAPTRYPYYMIVSIQ